MITEKDNVFYCDCGFSFERGRSGNHECGDGLRRMLESFRTAFMEYSEKTDWMQADKRFDVIKPLGKHRSASADVAGGNAKRPGRSDCQPVGA
ncbi:hypothetical protein P0300_004620 [Enterobacter hormaechei]